MEFEEAVKSVAAKVADLKDSIETEEATKTAFIMPFIGQVLGYDVNTLDSSTQKRNANVSQSMTSTVSMPLLRKFEVKSGESKAENSNK